MTARAKALPKDFVSRRLHSLMGLWLVVFLIEHLLTNSQAALLFSQDGSGFIKMVNLIYSIPYLHVVELLLLATPFVIHIVWGIKYMRTSKANAHATNGAKPNLRRYPRNHAFSWQRITAWILIVGVTAHVVQMRFIKSPEEVRIGGTQVLYMVKLNLDNGLYTVADRLGVELYDSQEIAAMQEQFEIDAVKEAMRPKIWPLGNQYSEIKQHELDQAQAIGLERQWLEAAEAKPLKPNQVLAVAPSPGVAFLLNVRETMRDPWMIALYSIFVIVAVYHAFNGLWSASIVWGVTLTARSQLLMKRFCILLMIVLGFLGLAAAWGTYWLNLRW
jgi:succinate dehydrogenase cytochrome b subunit